MAEDLTVQGTTKAERYQSLLPQVKALLEGETDLIANMANVCAAIREAFGFFWIGFYLVKDNQLVLGPFQGPVACTRIALGKGVCGTSWKEQKTLIVDDVDAFPGHIACSSLSKSEIVIPLYNAAGAVCGVLDIDSDSYASFNAEDEVWLKQIIALLKFA